MTIYQVLHNEKVVCEFNRYYLAFRAVAELGSEYTMRSQEIAL